MCKKILTIALLALGIANIAYAERSYGSDLIDNFNAGIYVGGAVGFSNLNYNPTYTLVNNTVENHKFAARGYVGYAFSQFISLELGYNYYGAPNFKNSTTGNTQIIRQQGIDLAAKATLPLDYGFGIYLKGGLAWIQRSALHNNTYNFAEHEANSRVTPLGGLGLVYWFAPNIALDLSWTKTMAINNLPTIDCYTLGLSYKFNI